MDVVLGFDAERSGIGLWGVGLALVNEGLRDWAEICVEDSDEAREPGVGEMISFFLGVSEDSFEVTVHGFGHFVVGVFFVAVVKSGVCFFGQSAVFIEDVEDVGNLTALCEVCVSVKPHEALCFVDVAVADDEHLREVCFFSAHSEDFVFEKTDSGEAPAGSAFVLVFDGSGFHHFDVGEFKTGRVRDYDVVVGVSRSLHIGCAEREGEKSGDSSRDKLFHGMVYVEKLIIKITAKLINKAKKRKMNMCKKEKYEIGVSLERVSQRMADEVEPRRVWEAESLDMSVKPEAGMPTASEPWGLRAVRAAFRAECLGIAGALGRWGRVTVGDEGLRAELMVPAEKGALVESLTEEAIVFGIVARMSESSRHGLSNRDRERAERARERLLTACVAG